MSQFEPKWDPLVLLQVVPVVLRAANPEQPELVTQRAYNAARGGAGYPDSPRADKLAAKFGVPWSRLTAAVVSEENPVVALAKADYTRSQEWRSETEIVSALRTAAALLGTNHINKQSYERARSAINGGTRQRRLHGRSIVPLPSAMVLNRRMPFAEAVAKAGLRVTPLPTGNSIPRSEIVVLFVEHCGFAPQKVHLIRFARLHDIRLADPIEERHSSAVLRAKARFQQLGRWFPAVRRGSTPADWTVRLAGTSAELRSASQRHPAKKQGGFTTEELREAIHRAFDLLEPGRRLTYAEYVQVREHHSELPHMGSLRAAAKRHGTSWPELVRDVAAERAEAARRDPPVEPSR